MLRTLVRGSPVLEVAVWWTTRNLGIWGVGSQSLFGQVELSPGPHSSRLMMGNSSRGTGPAARAGLANGPPCRYISKQNINSQYVSEDKERDAGDDGELNITRSFELKAQIAL
jgi:hypothetical protein